MILEVLLKKKIENIRGKVCLHGAVLSLVSCPQRQSNSN
jgi:hypothetical protein